MFEQMMFVNTSPRLLKGLDVLSAYGCLHEGMKPSHGEMMLKYRMDLNFRGTKLSRIEHFRVFHVFIFADARPTILY